MQWFKSNFVKVNVFWEVEKSISLERCTLQRGGCKLTGSIHPSSLPLYTLAL